MLSDGIISLIIGSASALVALLCKLSYSSKCTKVLCCGCIEITRDTAHEQPLNLNSTPSIPQTQNNMI